MPKIAKKPYRRFLGVDPGKKGGICWIDTNGQVMPYRVPESEQGIYRVMRDIAQAGSPTAVIEKVWAMPARGKRQGTSSMFSFGMIYGSLRMALIAAGIPFQEHTPKSWQKDFDVKGREEGEDKRLFKMRLRDKAEELFPEMHLWREPRSKVLQLELCDSILIAEFCRRKFQVE